ncbi:MAG: ATP synthase F1 subunit epsilon [Azospirillum brasilense]|nr:MAG: ATP synthase F1 subunit epsilon [Azospirillum brasilense]
MAELFPLQIVSPARVVYEGAVEMVEIPGYEGDFGVLAGHAPFFSMIRPGVITIHEGAAKQRLFVSAGYADVSPEGTTVLSDHLRDLASVTVEEAAAAVDAAQTAQNVAESEAEKAAAAKQLAVAEALVLALKAA